MAHYQHTDPLVWTGRRDGDEPDVLRWHQVIRCIDLDRDVLPTIGHFYQGIALLGFCSDEGVRRNQGRVGAAIAPRFIREACRNFPLFGTHIILVDAGDVVCPDHRLEEAQALLGQKIVQLRGANYLPIVLGGGHEVSYGSFLGLQKTGEKGAYGVVNFDAHFDLRMVEPETGATSGTGFWQMHEWCREGGREFYYLPVGIQPYANSRRLFETADDMGARYVLAENCLAGYFDHIVKDVNVLLTHADTVQLSIDMDVFAAAYAPGVSALSYNGILPDLLFKRLIRHIIVSGKVGAIDIAELNPKFDLDNRTARLAASIIFDLVQAADVNAEYPG